MMLQESATCRSTSGVISTTIFVKDTGENDNVYYDAGLP